MRNCTRCQGTGKYSILNEPAKACLYCQEGYFPEINETEIMSLIMASRGKNKGKLRSSMTSPFRQDGVIKNRAYYVWRMARFHAGIDVTMPMMASLCINGDPYRKELDDLSDKVAADSFGNNIAGAMIWGKALGMILGNPPKQVVKLLIQ